MTAGGRQLALRDGLLRSSARLLMAVAVFLLGGAMVAPASFAHGHRYGASAAARHRQTVGVVGAAMRLHAGGTDDIRLRVAGTSHRCGLTARSGRHQLGMLRFKFGGERVVVTASAPRRARSLAWTVALRCARCSRNLQELRAAKWRLHLHVLGRVQGGALHEGRPCRARAAGRGGRVVESVATRTPSTTTGRPRAASSARPLWTNKSQRGSTSGLVVEILQHGRNVCVTVQKAKA